MNAIRRTPTRDARRHGLLGRLARVIAVAALIVFGQLGPGSPIAAAGGFDCKDVPMPEYPKAAFPAKLDSSSANRPAPSGEHPTGYQSYGWAGLRWYTYDLGCGSDLVRAPEAVADTKLGNTFLTTGKSMAAAAFWLDDQTKTGQAARKAGIEPALAQFDKIVKSVSHGMLGVYGIWLGVGLMAATAVMLWQALKANAAGVTKTAAVAAAGLALGALMVGAPAKAIEVADETFGSLITETQDQMFSVSFGDDGGGTLAGGANDPRNVLLDRIFLDDWRQGWFGANYDDSQNQLGPKLRESLAFSYIEQEQITADPAVQDRLVQQKERIFRDEIVKPLESHNLSFYTFQGKDSGRSGIGFMAMIKLGLPSILWIGASILKLTALLAIRFAILFAPVWVPLAVAHGGALMRVCRMLATAYLWGVAGAVIVALYLMALVQLYVTDNGSVDGSWRLWFMVLLSAVCWFIMRPFKRISQTFTQNHASVLNRKARTTQHSLKRQFLRGIAGAVGGPGAAVAEEAVGGMRKASRRGGGDLDTDSVSPIRSEGKGLASRRNDQVNQARTQARKELMNRDRVGSSSERDARIAGIAASASSDAARGDQRGKQGQVDDTDAARAAEAGVAARQRLDQEAAETGKDNRRELARAASVSQRWDGGEGSIIAPMRVYTPARGKNTAAGVTPMIAISAPRRDSGGGPRPKVWDPAPRRGRSGDEHRGRYN
ncbi:MULTISPECIES: hypothetical protein [unclassified Nocardia]|uniref:hypothetical protein n=1 Tax=unclassified Nocardia TaxID=2637762 RepID=UPI001CE4A2AC|nr:MULTISPECIES: hypothetical protein [unclassified Nocardia]